MPPVSQRFSIPTNNDAFEQMCLQLLRLYWSRPRLEIFGKRGERQYGIDILDVGGEISIYAAQCKLKEEHKSLPPADIQKEVDKAKQFTPPLGKYAILTTAKVSTLAQRKVREINQSHKATGLFEVELFTWERICSLLQQYTDVQEHFYGEIALGRATRMEAQLVTIKGGVQSLTSRIEGDAVDSEINEARECIGKREFQLATLLLNRVQRNQGDKLTSRQKFRVLSNHGAAMLGLGKPETAAKLFLEAAQWQPEDEQGKINEVLAFLLVGDLSSCHAKAALLRKDFPGSSRLAALWLNSSPIEASFSAAESEINPVLRSDPEVCVALARKALVEFAFDNAFKYASSASNLAPKWPQPHLVLAQTSLGEAIHVQLGFQAKSVSQEKSLLDAEQACSRAIDLAREDKDAQTETVALVLRVEIQLLLKKTVEAIEDAEKAERLDSENPDVVLAVAQTRFASDRIEDGMASFKKAYRLSQRPDIAFVYGTALQNRGRDSDLDEALNILLQISLSAIRSELRPTTVMHVIQCFAKKKDWSGAEAYLAKTLAFLDATVLSIMRGYLAHFQGQQQEAERHALEAMSLITTNVNADTKESLARLLMLIGRPGDALPLWQDLFDREAPVVDPKNLLACAARLHRDDVVLQTCERLYLRGVTEWDLIEFESQYLEKYKIDAAIERLQSFIVQHPDHKLAKLRLSLIGLRLNKPELVRGGPEDLPSVEAVPVNYVAAAVQIAKFGGNPNAAVDYAYRFLRAHFNEIEAHQALIASMMPGPFAPDIPARHEIVGPGSAVHYQELPLGDPTWVVLEDTDAPSGEFEEISLSSFLATELAGKRVGDTVLLTKGAMQDRSVRILEILPKYVRRYQDSMGEMQVRFGAASSVQSVRVELSEDGRQQKGLEVILASVEKRAAAVADARETYTKLPASLHWFGARFDGDAYHAVLNLARVEGQNIKCCFGTSEERSQALQALQTANAVIVDITALATLRLLNLETVLSSTKFHFVVSERTWVTLREMLSEARFMPAPNGMLCFKDGKHVMYEETDDTRDKRHREEEEFVRLLEKVTERRAGVGLAALHPEKREALEKFFGPYGAESMMLASDPDNVFWTDDLIQAQTSAQEFPPCQHL